LSEARKRVEGNKKASEKAENGQGQIIGSVIIVIKQDILRGSVRCHVQTIFDIDCVGEENTISV
jgi:hypothetical protein